MVDKNGSLLNGGEKRKACRWRKECPSVYGCKTCTMFEEMYEEIQVEEKEELKCSYCNIILDEDALFCKLCGRATKRSRHIPASVKREVWQRDEGRCVECGSKERLEYDHIIPFSKGGSNTARNIQLLCEKCNRTKHNQI